MFRVMEVSSFAIRGRGGTPASVYRLRRGLMRSAPIARRRPVFWMVSISLRYEGEVRS